MLTGVSTVLVKIRPGVENRAGTYEVRVGDVPCTATSGQLLIDNPVCGRISDFGGEFTMVCDPNPIQGRYLTIQQLEISINNQVGWRGLEITFLEIQTAA